MNCTKDVVINAILRFAKIYNEEDSYLYLIEINNSALPELCKKIVYDMFLHKFDPFMSQGQIYEDYKIIFQYTDELSKNGYVTFN